MNKTVSLLRVSGAGAVAVDGDESKVETVHAHVDGVDLAVALEFSVGFDGATQTVQWAGVYVVLPPSGDPSMRAAFIGANADRRDDTSSVTSELSVEVGELLATFVHFGKRGDGGKGGGNVAFGFFAEAGDIAIVNGNRRSPPLF